jgi:predicted Zn-dependent protease
MSPAQETRIGAEEHPKILTRFGGVYRDRRVSGYVAEIGGRLVHNAEVADLRFTFTVLNTPVVNAFALPGGYVYVTRGLIALANSEAELAGVIAHEIGHVVARHTAERYSRSVVARLGEAILGTLTKSGDVGRLARLGSELYLRGFSREQEYEADLLSVRYLRRAGYDTYAQAAFLEILGRHSTLMNHIEGRPGAERELDFFATHPRAADRVERVIAAAGAGVPIADAPRRRAAFLATIEGMLYGDDPEQGFVRGERFSHPSQRFTFTVPRGFRLINTMQAVFAKGPEDATLRFDAAPQTVAYDPLHYLTREWARGAEIAEIERIRVNGFDAATARARVVGRNGPADLRLVAIRFDDEIMFRMLFMTPPRLTARLAADFRRTTFSFRRLSEREAAALKPLRLWVAVVDADDTLDSLAAKAPFEPYMREWLRVLNGLAPDQPIEVGRRIKYVAE